MPDVEYLEGDEMPFYEDNLPKVHPREMLMSEAEGEFGVWFSRFSRDKELTYAERIYILSHTIQFLAQQCLSLERKEKDVQEEKVTFCLECGADLSKETFCNDCKR